VSPCLPAIIPCSCVREDAGFANRSGGGGEVLCRREPFVGAGEDAGAERFVDEICESHVSEISAIGFAWKADRYCLT